MRFLLLFCLQNTPPIDCTSISLREESKTASQLQISFVTFLEAGGNHVLGNISRGKVCLSVLFKEDEMGFGCLGLVGFVLMDAFVFGNCADSGNGLLACSTLLE
jgi:hypothetical protein